MVRKRNLFPSAQFTYDEWSRKRGEARKVSVRRCEVCRFRNYAERKPKSLLAHIWRWHTGWCPGWKSYIKEREAEQTPSPTSPTDS